MTGKIRNRKGLRHVQRRFIRTTTPKEDIQMRIPTRAAVAGALSVIAIVVATTVSLAGDSGGGRSGRSVPPFPGGGSTGSGGGLTTEPICAEEEPVAATGSDTSVSSGCLDTPTGTPPDPGPQIVEPTPGMADVYPRIFDTATVANDGVTVTIDFVSGVEPCYVLDRVDVGYDTDTVTITLFEGHDPTAGDVACIEIGVFKRVVITLDEPVGGRAIVDGAA